MSRTCSGPAPVCPQPARNDGARFSRRLEYLSAETARPYEGFNAPGASPQATSDSMPLRGITPTRRGCVKKGSRRAVCNSSTYHSPQDVSDPRFEATQAANCPPFRGVGCQEPFKTGPSTVDSEWINVLRYQVGAPCGLGPRSFVPAQTSGSAMWSRQRPLTRIVLIHAPPTKQRDSKVPCRCGGDLGMVRDGAVRLRQAADRVLSR